MSINPLDTIQWREPWPCGKHGDAHITLQCLAEDAIKIQKAAHPDADLTDEQFLEDFITIHWAGVIPYTGLKDRHGLPTASVASHEQVMASKDAMCKSLKKVLGEEDDSA